MANNICMSFDIDNDDYEKFIKDLRKEVTRSTSHDIPVLMPQSEPLSWLDVILISGRYRIMLRIERRNLYVRGYSTNDGTDFWEFSDSSLIPGSRSLGYSGSYVASRGVVNVAGVQRENLPLGYSPLQNAISNLAGITSPDSDQAGSARPLLIIAQIIAEATRIKLIAEHIVQNWFNPRPITLQMQWFENTWGTFSSAVQRADTPVWNDGTPLPNVPNPNVPNIWTVGQAILAFGILLYHPPGSRQRVTRAVTESSSNTSYIRTLVNIEYVRVNDIDGEEPSQLYGTVMVKDCWSDHTVYDRSSDNYESKGPGDDASLTGPSTAISGEDAFIISVSLWDHDRLSPDDEIAKGDVVWDPRDTNSSYDTNLEEFVSGKYGSVSVGYWVIREALSATIKVVMINGDEESPAEVYGNIEASRVLEGSPTTRMLFDKSENEYVEVSPQQSISLIRPVFPVPVDSDLTIAVDLWDHDTLSPDDQIALGSVQFTPMFGTQEKNITGKYGSVQVSITCE